MNNGPQREQILTLESECVILFRNRVFADVITLRIFKKKNGEIILDDRGGHYEIT